MFIRNRLTNCIKSNIIKRTFSHHRDLIQIPGSTLHDKEKIEDLTNKINSINSKIYDINIKIYDIVDFIDKTNKYMFFNFVMINCISIPFLLFRGY
jgi:hypothetical protein